MAIALTSAIAPRVRAEPRGDAKQHAAERFESARAAFARGEYANAAETFEQAAAIAPHPATLMNAAEAWERAGEMVRAAEVCDRITAMPYLDGRYVDLANAMLRRNAAKIATLDVVAPADGHASVDGGGEQNLPHRWRLSPGTHTLLVVDKAKGAYSVSLSLRGGEARVADTRPRETPPPQEAHGGPPAGAWIAFGAATAALGIGATFGVETLMSRDDYEAVPNHATADAFYRNRAIANVALFTGIAAAGVGVALLLFSHGRRDAPRRPVGRLQF